MLKHKFKIILYPLLFSLLVACSSNTTTNKTVLLGDTDSLNGLIEMGGSRYSVTDKNGNSKQIRYTAIQETALSIGAQSGLAYHARDLNRKLQLHAKNLDQIYNFNALMLDHNVLPPVLVEGHNELNLAGPNTIRISDQRYTIAKQARFVTTSPNWRQYLWLDYKLPPRPDNSLLPEDPQEEQAWKYYVAEGWKQGSKQSARIFNDNLARLKRDYKGMILYRKLLALHMVSPPYVSHTSLGVTGNPSEIHIDDRVLRITSLPQLQTDSNDWQAAVSINKELLHKLDKMGNIVDKTKLTISDPNWQAVIANNDEQ